MPTYEYACKSCGQHLEVVQSFKDDALQTCPACDGPLRKVFGSIGIAFKGSGFYRNDSRSASGRQDKAASDKASSENGSSDKGSSDKSSEKTGSDSSSSADKSSSGPSSSDKGSSGSKDGSKTASGSAS